MALLDIPPRPSHRRRIVVFCTACILAGALSLTYTYMRPPVYQAVARLQIVPGSADAPANTADAKVIIPGEKDTMPFLTEVQVLTSRPVLSEALEHLDKEGGVPALGEDHVSAVQRMLRAEPVGGTQIVQLSAEGAAPDFLARLVNTVADVYRRHVAGSYKDTSADKLAQVGDEIADLETQVAAQRKTVEDYAARYDIVSAERDENAALGKLSGLNKSLEEANSKLAAAQGRVQALRVAIAAGQSGIQAKDDPTVADLEKRASVLREQWQELQRRFTPQYLAMDKDAQSLRARLDSLEQQIVQARKTGQQVALAGAQEDLTGAQTAVEQLRQQMADAQRDAKEFATRLSQYKAMESDLTHIEALHRDALDRQAKLKSSEPARAPQVALLEAAVPSQDPVRPAYTRDALISVAGSLCFGLFAVWLAEFLAPGEAAPRMILGQGWGGPALGHAPPPQPALARPEMMQLAAPDLPPRELADGEITALLEAASDDAKIVMVGLLMGLSVAELVQLRWEQLDRDKGALNLPGDAPRALALEEPLRGLIALRQPADPAAAVIAGADGPLDAEEIARMVLYAAFDAGLERPDEVTPRVLRYTYLAFLLRQGIRVADIGRLAGRVPQDELVAYMRFAPPMQRLPFDKIERVMPALRQQAGQSQDGRDATL